MSPYMKGLDILARAKTGSGKTVAFLLPSIETVLRLGPAGPNAISVLVLSPTREAGRCRLTASKPVLTPGVYGYRVRCVRI